MPIGQSRSIRNVVYKKQNDEKQNKTTTKETMKKGNTAHKSGNKLSNELKFNFYNKIKTAWFNTKIKLS